MLLQSEESTINNGHAALTGGTRICWHSPPCYRLNSYFYIQMKVVGYVPIIHGDMCYTAYYGDR